MLDPFLWCNKIILRLTAIAIISAEDNDEVAGFDLLFCAPVQSLEGWAAGWIRCGSVPVENSDG